MILSGLSFAAVGNLPWNCIYFEIFLIPILTCFSFNTWKDYPFFRPKDDGNQGVYICSLLQQLVIYETSASELDIIRDISRTFPSHVFFQQRHGPGQRSLYNVLKAYSVFDRNVGYVQVPDLLYFIISHVLTIVFGGEWYIMFFERVGDGIFSWVVASLYEWRGCILAVGCFT